VGEELLVVLIFRMLNVTFRYLDRQKKSVMDLISFLHLSSGM
jgi:hypothetical protein